MSFGQSPGPPATGEQIPELTELLEPAGHIDGRARGRRNGAVPEP